MQGTVMAWPALLVLRTLVAGWLGFVLDALVVALAAGPAAQQAAQAGVTVAWERTPLYVALALATFAVSAWATTPSPRAYLRAVCRGLRSQSRATHRHHALSAALTAGYEETVWRLVCLPALTQLLPKAAAVVLISALFTFWHRHRTQRQPLLVLELFGFSAWLGVLFLVLADPWLVILVHATRNYLISAIGQCHEEI